MSGCQGNSDTTFKELKSIDILSLAGHEPKGDERMGIIMTDSDETTGGVIQFGTYTGRTPPDNFANFVAEYPGVAGFDTSIFVFIKGDSGHDVSTPCATICKI
jgi:hypothetical protein